MRPDLYGVTQRDLSTGILPPGDGNLDPRCLALDVQARSHMVEALRLWLVGADPRASYAAAAALWREAGDPGSLLRAMLAERRASGLPFSATPH